ncbi:MAG TPA: hypothetical protein VNB30_08545 [Rhizomicrobium sp.]|jgi:hypothetical protein|nr:hypothetical protein [Rhizomicrobium sp.]
MSRFLLGLIVGLVFATYLVASYPETAIKGIRALGVPLLSDPPHAKIR